jgi:outer membrane receptor protein involved in Fe transport
MSNELEAWHKPSFDVSFSANYNIQDKILLRASVVANGAMKAPKWTNGVQTSETIDAWVDVNLGVEYRYRKKIGFFLNLNNLTASRYDRWYNYPAYRFNFMAGMNYIF